MNAAGRDGARWASSLAVVLGLHLAATAGAVWWSGRAGDADAGEGLEAMVVELAPEPSAPPAPPSELPPGPEQQAQPPRPAARPAPRPPEPMPELPPVPVAVAEASLPEPRPDDRQAPEEASQLAVDLSRAPPKVQARDADAYAAPLDASGASATAVATWQGMLLAHLEKHRRYPRAAERARQEGVAYVRFTVDRQGRVSGARISRGSGHSLLDEETMATLRRADPVPPPLPAIEGERVEVMVPVSFFIRRR